MVRASFLARPRSSKRWYRWRHSGRWRAAAGGGERGQVQRVAERPGAALGELLLADEGAALPRVGLQPGVGHHLVDAREPGHVAQLGADGGGVEGPDARDAAQAPAVLILA
jgi:hypothetical protein